MNLFNAKIVIFAICLGISYAQLQQPGISPYAGAGQLPFRGQGQYGVGVGSGTSPYAGSGPAQFPQSGISPNAIAGQLPFRGQGQYGAGVGSGTSPYASLGPVGGVGQLGGRPSLAAGSLRPQVPAGAGSSLSNSAGGAPDSRFLGLLTGGGGLFGGGGGGGGGGLFSNLIGAITGNRRPGGYAGGYPYPQPYPVPAYPGFGGGGYPGVGGGGYPGFGGGYPGFGGGNPGFGGGYGGPGFYG